MIPFFFSASFTVYIIVKCIVICPFLELQSIALCNMFLFENCSLGKKPSSSALAILYQKKERKKDASYVCMCMQNIYTHA